jgi:cell division protein FtsW
MTNSIALEHKRDEFDMSIVAVTAALVGIGMVAIFSATFAKGALSSRGSLYFVERQLIAAVLGTAAMLILARMNIGRIRLAGYSAVCVAAFALLLVLFLGEKINGAHRWFHIGFLHLQPSEFAKLALLVAAARYATENPRDMRSLKGLLRPMAAAAALAALVVVEPDLGTAIVILALAFLVFHFGGARMRHLGVYVAAGLAFVLIAVAAEPYRITRVIDWIKRDPTSLTGGYQLRHSMIALGAGGLVGRGIGEGHEKYYYLPAAETDCIFAIIGEEAGLIGTWAVLALFGVLAWRGLTVSLRAAEPFCVILGAGVTAMIMLQVIINVAVVIGAAPTKGAPLPFISYGGSSLIFSMAAVGLLLNISRQPACGLRPAPLAARGDAESTSRTAPA